MAKWRQTLVRVFEEPPPANLKWSAIEAMLGTLGAELQEGRGSRLRVRLGGRMAVLHRPHPSPQATRPQVRAVRMLLEQAGFRP